MQAILTTLRRFARPIGVLLIVLSWIGSDRRRRRRFTLGALTLVLVGGVAADLALPHRHLPWRPLDIDAAPGLATGFKLRVIDLGPASWCEGLLARSGILDARALDAHEGSGRCGWSDGFHIAASGAVTLRGKTDYPMRCPLAAGAHIWLTGADRRARETFGSPLARVHHAGTYSCRRMYNRQRGRMSEHAFANAWDVTGFELADGRVISVQEHWSARGRERDFLRAVRDDACRVFNVVLGPEYNAAHHDHFHLDMGGGTRCR